MTKLYNFQEVTSAIYYDVISMMGEEGLDAKLTAYDLLAVMAAPCTRLDYANTDGMKRTPLMEAVHKFMNHNNQLTNLTHQRLVKELNASFLPTLSNDKLKELLTGFRMVMDFDADGYAIFDKKYYDVYKGNMDRGATTKIKYAALNGLSVSSGLPDKEITKIYYMQRDNYIYHLDLDITVNDWFDILRGASEKAIKLIGAFCQVKNHRASHAQIEEKCGILRETINGITAGIGTRAKRLMGIEVLNTDGNPCCWILPFNNGRVDDTHEFVWELRPEVAEAYEKLMK